jgi:hypothetical protein
MPQEVQRQTKKMKIAWLISMGQDLAPPTQCGVQVVVKALAPLSVKLLQTVIVIKAAVVLGPIQITTHAFNSTHIQNAAAVAVDGLPVVMLA